MDRSVIEKLYNTHGPTVLRRARMLLGSDADAHDAMQEVFVILLEKGASFRGDSAVLTWVYSVTTNVCLGRLRSGNRKRLLLSERGAEVPHGMREQTDPDDLATLRGLLAAVPPEEAQAGVFHWVDGMTLSETAEVMGCSRRKVGYMLERFLERTQKHLATQPRLGVSHG